VNVPKVLQPYLRGLTFIPFVHPVPVDEVDKKASGKGKGKGKAPAGKTAKNQTPAAASV
jgi:hypothetical protein